MDNEEDSLLEFPCEFPIKVFGRSGPAFDAKIVTIVRQHVPDLAEGAVRTQASSKGNYVSVTVNVIATSREQLDAIYMDLTACPEVMMAL